MKKRPFQVSGWRDRSAWRQKRPADVLQVVEAKTAQAAIEYMSSAFVFDVWIASSINGTPQAKLSVNG